MCRINHIYNRIQALISSNIKEIEEQSVQIFKKIGFEPENMKEKQKAEDSFQSAPL